MLWHQSAVTLFVLYVVCFVTDGSLGVVFNDKLPIMPTWSNPILCKPGHYLNLAKNHPVVCSLISTFLTLVLLSIVPIYTLQQETM